MIVIQKKAVIIAGAKYRAPTDALFSDLGILKSVDVNIYLTMLFMFRVHNNMVPDQFQMMFNYNRDIHPYVARQSNQLHIPMAKTNLGKKCTKYHGSVIRNKVIKPYNGNLFDLLSGLGCMHETPVRCPLVAAAAAGWPYPPRSRTPCMTKTAAEGTMTVTNLY